MERASFSIPGAGAGAVRAGEHAPPRRRPGPPSRPCSPAPRSGSPTGWPSATGSHPLLRRAGRRGPPVRRRPGAAGVEPGDRVAIWCFNCAEWIVAVLGIFAAGGGARAGEHPLQGRRGGRHPVPVRGPGARHRHRLPGHRLRGHARGHGRRPPGARDDRGRPRGCEPPAPCRGGTSWRGPRRIGGRGAAPQRRPRPGRPLRHPLHLGDDGRPQGRRHDARPHADRGHRLGRHDGPHAPATSTSR